MWEYPLGIINGKETTGVEGLGLYVGLYSGSYSHIPVFPIKEPVRLGLPFVPQQSCMSSAEADKMKSCSASAPGKYSGLGFRV